VISGATKLCAVIGDPVRHSLSPTLHNAAFAALDLDWVYVAFPVFIGNGQAAMSAFRTLGISGFSVTMPHKFEVASAVDRLTTHATALGSCNTVFRDPDDASVLWGDSTDGPGFIGGLRHHQIDPSGKRFAVIGAGGAGRAVIDALGRAGAADIAVVNRDATKAETAVALAPMARVGDFDDIRDSDVIVNATSLGMRAEDAPPCPTELLQPHHVVNDLIYSPAQTPLLASAAACGAIGFNGLSMLVHQAALQFERWTSCPAPLQAMVAAVEAELLKRQHR
jgi:shikimate dehydrogenase